MKALERRIEALEERQALYRQPVKSLSTLKAALLILATMREGEEAEKEVAAANGCLDPERRAKLTKTVEVARSIAATVAKSSASQEDTISNEETAIPRITAEPALPAHAYIRIEEGALERSGTRAWLAMAGREVLSTFHGDDARELARDWMRRKYAASPAEEIEVSLEEDFAA